VVDGLRCVLDSGHGFWNYGLVWVMGYGLRVMIGLMVYDLWSMVDG